MSRDFQTFQSFASASLQDIYTEPALAQALRFEVNELRSGVLLNDGHGRFEFTPLPALAQISPGFGLSVLHLNDDQYPDLVMLQNHYTPQRETTRMSAGLGVVLLGDGQGGFNAVWPANSGLIVPGDGKSLAVTLTRDGRFRLLAAQNNDTVLPFTTTSPPNAVLTIRLRFVGANRNAIGARVTMHYANGEADSAEVYAGTGYLSQSTPTVMIGLGGRSPVRAMVRWPDGEESLHEVRAAKGPVIELARPAPPAPANTP